MHTTYNLSWATGQHMMFAPITNYAPQYVFDKKGAKMGTEEGRQYKFNFCTPEESLSQVTTGNK